MKSTNFLLIVLTFLLAFSRCTNPKENDVNATAIDSLAQTKSIPTQAVEEEKPTLDGVYYMVVSTYGVDAHNFLAIRGEQITARTYTMGMAIEYETEMIGKGEKEFKACSPYDKRGCNNFYIKPDKLIASSGHTYDKIADTYDWEGLEEKYKIESAKVKKFN